MSYLRLYSLPLSFSITCVMGLWSIPAAADTTNAFVHPAANLGKFEVKPQEVFPSVRVTVRAIKGCESIDPKTDRTTVSFSIDRRLTDLSSKLQRLNFKTFTLLTQQDKVVPVSKKQEILLGGGHTLMVRPLYLSDNRNKVGMWLRWQDGLGNAILDTRMHFVSGENMVTGTDSVFEEGGEENGMILAIAVSPAAPALPAAAVGVGDSGPAH